MRVYESIVSDNENVFKTVNVAKNKKELLNIYGGNGTFEKIADITETVTIDPEKVRSILESKGMSKVECDLVSELVLQHNKDNNINLY